MTRESQQPNGRDDPLSKLGVAIDALNLATDASGVAPAQAAFGAASTLLTTIRDSMSNEEEYVEIGLNCADICRALDRGMGGKGPDDLSQPVCEAINQLTTTVAKIQRKATKQSGRNQISRLVHARSDKEKLTAWKLELDRILQVFNTELVVNTRVAVSGIRDDVAKIREEVSGRVCAVQTSMVGELPPPPPRDCFGRDDLTELIVGLAENLNSIALIGAGGIGKTSIALTVLHHSRIKERFGHDRRFMRCDQFPASRVSFLHRLSKVIGACVENPEDLTPLRPSLSSKEMLVVLDNAESILDPQGVDAQEIYDVVDELSQFTNICLVITSRISTIPPNCETFDIPMLSMEASRDTFYRIHTLGGRPDSIDNLLEQLDFHPLSIALLATVAHQNKWDHNRLAREWEKRHTGVLRTEHNKSLGATVELSLASPMFKQLGPDARDLLGVIAFFPRGVNEGNIGWLFPTTPNIPAILDKFCMLSLTYRSDGFVTMLAPLRDHLRPRDPLSSPLLSVAKESYFARLSFKLNTFTPVSKGTGWITSEDANVEHLLNVLTSIEAKLDGVWRACANFMCLLCLHKPRKTVLGPKIEALPDDHHFKPECLFQLGWLFDSVGNYAEEKRVLTHALKLERERGNDDRIALTLAELSDANRMLHLYEEGIRQAKEALGIYERIGDTTKQGFSLIRLAWVLLQDEQLNGAEEAVSRAIQLLPEKGEEFSACQSHFVLGNIYCFKGEREEAIHHFETALRIASCFGWNAHLFWIRYSLAELFRDEAKFDDAHVHIEQAKSLSVGNVHYLGCALVLQAGIYHQQGRREDATSEALRALEAFEKLGALVDIDRCRDLLQRIEQATKEAIP